MLDRSTNFDTLPQEVTLNGILPRLSPETVSTVALVNIALKEAAYDSLEWKRKLKIHFPFTYEKLVVQQDKVNWQAEFCKTYNMEYETIPKNKRQIFSLIKESDAVGLSLLKEITSTDVNLKNKNGTFPLFLAAEKGNLNIIKFLCEHGANIDAVDWNGWTALHAAAGNGHFDTVKFLCEQGANINATSHGWTVLHVAAGNGHFDIVKFMYEQGINIDAAISNRSTALYVAALEGHFDIVKFLCEHGANINATDSEGWTALHAAAKYGRFDVFEFLCEQGANIDAVKLARSIAIQNRHVGIARRCLRYEADIMAAVDNDIAEIDEYDRVRYR